MQSKQLERTTGPCMAIYDNYLNKLTSDIFAQRFKVADAERLLEKKRKALMKAVQERKTLDKLKEKRLRAHVDNLNSKELKFINEMAISRFSMKQK